MDMYNLLRVISPPLGLGKNCPNRVAYKVCKPTHFPPTKGSVVVLIINARKIAWLMLVNEYTHPSPLFANLNTSNHGNYRKQSHAA